MDKRVLCYEIDVYRLVLFYILHVQNVIRFCVMVSMQNYSLIDLGLDKMTQIK